MCSPKTILCTSTIKISISQQKLCCYQDNKFSLNVRKRLKIELFQVNIFPQNWSPGQLECMFLLSQRTFCLKFRKDLELIIFKKVFVTQKATLEKKCSSHYSAASFSVSRQNNFGRSLERFTKLSSFQYKNCSLILDLWTGRRKFWQPCGKHFAWRPTFFRSKSGWTDEFKKIPKENSCPKRPILKRRINRYQQFCKYLKKDQKFSEKVQK